MSENQIATLDITCKFRLKIFERMYAFLKICLYLQRLFQPFYKKKG